MYVGIGRKAAARANQRIKGADQLREKIGSSSTMYFFSAMILKEMDCYFADLDIIEDRSGEQEECEGIQ